MFNALSKTLQNLGDRKLLGILLVSLLITLVLIIAFMAGAIWLLSATSFIDIAWLEWVFDAVGGVGAGIVAWFLIPVIMPALAGLFEEVLIRTVEKKDYPDAPKPDDRPFLPELWHDVKFILVSLGLNLLCLPLFLIPVIGQVLYYLLNSYLLGREFFNIAAGYHLGKKDANALRKQHRFTAMAVGFVLVLMANIPFVALLVPFIGVVAMVHVYHGIKNRQATA